MSALLLIRHGRTAWNRSGRFQGHADPILDRTGRRQAARLVPTFAGLQLKAVYSSDLHRATQTAQPLALAAGLPVATDPRLRELSFGEWEGLYAMSVVTEQATAWEAWQQDPLQRAPPGGETGLTLWRRFGAALADLCSGEGEGTIAVVTHGGPLMLLLSLLTAGRLQGGAPWRVPNGGWLLLSGHSVLSLLRPGPDLKGGANRP